MKKLSLFLAAALVASALEIAVANNHPSTLIKPGVILPNRTIGLTDTIPGKKNKKTPSINPTPAPTPAPTPDPSPLPAPTPTPTPTPNPAPSPPTAPPIPGTPPAPNPAPVPPKP